MFRKSLKEHYKYLFEEDNRKQQIIFSNKHSVNSIEEAIAIILSFNVLDAFLNDTKETMLQKAYKGDKVKGNSNLNINVGKEINFTKLLSPSGMNLKNAVKYANDEKDNVSNSSNIRIFIDLVGEAISFLESNEFRGVILESGVGAKINKMQFNIEVNKLLDDKLKGIVDQKIQKINLSKLIDYFQERLVKLIRFEIKSDENEKDSN